MIDKKTSRWKQEGKDNHLISQGESSMLDFYKLKSQRRWQRCLVPEAESLWWVCQHILQTRTKGLRASEGLGGKTNEPAVWSLRMAVGGNLFAPSPTSLICPVLYVEDSTTNAEEVFPYPFPDQLVLLEMPSKMVLLPVPCIFLYAVNLTFEIRHHRVELNKRTFHSMDYSFPGIGLGVWFPNTEFALETFSNLQSFFLCLLNAEISGCDAMPRC